jgi:hypothetical protein
VRGRQVGSGYRDLYFEVKEIFVERIRVVSRWLLIGTYRSCISRWHNLRSQVAVDRKGLDTAERRKVFRGFMVWKQRKIGTQIGIFLWF